MRDDAVAVRVSKQSAQWSGDAAHIVTARGSVLPKSGTHMLRFEPPTSDLFSRAYYIVDPREKTRYPERSSS